MWFVLLFVVLVLLSIIHLWNKSPYHPLLVYLGVWVIVIGLWSLDEVFSIIGYIKVSKEAWVNLSLAHISFVIGSVTATITLIYSQNRNRKLLPRKIIINKSDSLKAMKISNFFLILSFVGYLSYIYVVIQSVDFGAGLAVAFKQWNYEASYGQLAMFGGLSGRLYNLPTLAIPYNVFLISIFPEQKKRLIIISCIEIFFLISPRRAILIQTLMVVLFILLLTRTIRISIKILVIPIILLILFSFSQVVLNKGQGEGIFGGLKVIYLYITGNIPSFDLLMDRNREGMGLMSLSNFYKFLNAIGYRFENVDLSIDFVNIPTPFNTIPYNYYFLMDFGILGSSFVIFTGAYGITFLYYRTMTIFKYLKMEYFTYIYIYSYILMGILFSFRENVLISYNALFFILISIMVSLYFKFQTRIV
ncbi:oligosaccharide repeat unit polymerase [Paenibacillus sp. 19GGS1-52]|uniref:O-antigen polymerase n=1 Tax=Paenibacillus sp. 19GGS1-52 TaxID=2758563 RepID=UPI001EFB05CB|nr:O-antigen polymerase [Paenibacillus sp. 19GGS1-52]ULO08643.1 oligosaccharide repeat unit polymerase [Paenibacillus sp. 19GGS1-52]